MKEEGKKSGWKILLEGVKAIFQGELLLRLKFDKYLAHIAVVAAACLAVLFSRCLVEDIQVRRERMKAEVEEVRWKHQQTTIELVSLGKMSTVEDLLEKNGVNVGKPEKPATIIKD